MKQVIVAFLLLSVLSLVADNVQNQPYELTQPDGTKLSLYVSGNEFEHRMHDLQNYTILINPRSGYAVYAIPDGKSIMASEYSVGSVEPATLGISPGLKPDAADRQRMLQQRKEDQNSSIGRAPTTGTINNIVIFVRFLDQTEYTDQVSSYEQFFNSSTSVSLKGFFNEDSSNQLSINSTFYPAAVGGVVRSFQDGHNRGYFSPYNASANPIGYSDLDQGWDRMQALMRQAVTTVGPSVPSNLQVDMDNDNNVDNVIFMMQGGPDSQWSSVLWPQTWTLNQVPLVYINSKRVYRFNLIFSLGNLGTACHEMSHSLGFPDLYHYDDNGLTPVGSWDLMGTHTPIPQEHLTYMKWKYGHWISAPTVLTPAGVPTAYTLDAVDTNPNASYKIPSSDGRQFYMLEYRRNTGTYETGIPASGLIVYRICTEYFFNTVLGYLPLTGNSEGPPDEVYVYRPGADMWSDGQIQNCYYSSTVFRTSIHNFSDPKPTLYNALTNDLIDGNLAVTDIGAAGGTSISFTLHGVAPHVWKGTTSADWNTASNWSTGTVPGSTAWVEIPQSVFINGSGWTPEPVINGTANAKHITILRYASIFVSDGILGVAENLDNFGTLGVSHANAQLVIHGNLSFFNGSHTYLYEEAHIYLEGDLNLFPGCDFDMYGGYLEFNGTGDSHIRTHTDAKIYRLLSNKGYPYAVYISGDSSQSLAIRSGVFVYAGSTLRQTYGGSTILYGSLNVYEDGYCALNNGTISMQGITPGILNIVDPESYLHHLIINKTSGISVTMNANLWVKYNVSIQSGVLNASSRTLKFGGNWTNSVGTAGFNRGVSTVMLYGTDNQSVSTERFYRLELNKSGGVWNIGTGQTIVTDYYNWTAGTYNITGGSFSTTILDDPGIFGTINISGGTVNYNQSSSAALDLRGNVTISGGTFNLSGGNGNVYFAYQNSATLNMSAGVLDLKTNGIFIPSAYSFTENITGGTIKTVGSITIQRADFTPTGGTIECYGSQNVWLNSHASSYFHDLQINKAPARTDLREISATASSNLNIQGSLTISSGSFDPNGYNINVFNDMLVNSSLKLQANSIIQVMDDINWLGGANVNNGTIYCGGNWLFGASSTANLTGCTVYLNNPYGCSITNNSATASFGNLQISGTDEDPLCSFSGATLSVAGTLTVNETNTLNLNQNACLAGFVNIHPTAGLIVGDGGLLTVNSTLTLAGALNVGPGSVAVHGFWGFPASGSLSINGGAFINDSPWIERGTIHLYGGLDIIDGTLEISDNNAYLYNHALRNFNNADLRLGRSFYATEAGAYHPGGGTLTLIGNASASLAVTNGNYLNHLVLQKSDPTSVVSLSFDTTVNGNLTVNGGSLDHATHNLYSFGNVNVNSELIIGPGASLEIAANKALSVNSGGKLRLQGEAGNHATVTRSGSSGYFAFDVFSGGTIAAEYALFQYMNAYGVYIHAGAIVETDKSFNYCIFRNGAAGGRLLKVDNMQNLNIYAANFPANTWSGTYNVSKTNAFGTLNFTNYSGAFAGASFEQDNYNRITWTANGIPVVQNVSLSYQANPASVQLTWEYPYTYSSFKILSCSTPEGVFTQIGTSSSLSWTGPISAEHNFYRVQVVLQP